MLPADVEARAAAIAADTESGASALAMRALEAFEVLCTEPRTADELHTLAARLEAAQPSMAAVRNVAQLCVHLLAAGGEPRFALREVRKELERAEGKIARNALKVFSGSRTLLTVSRSAAVVAAMTFLHGRGRVKGAYVLESRPGFEGRRTAEELVAAGIDAHLVADALGPSLVRKVDAVLVGADSVLLDGALVNKIGTYPLALAAKAAGIPFHAACAVLKMDARHTAATFPGAETRPSEELEPPKDVRAINVYFDLTPAELVTSYVTDKGVYAPGRIARLLAF